MGGAVFTTERNYLPPIAKQYEVAMANLDHEQAVIAENGTQLIAGLDEAGRGAIAGPVVAAAVILPLDDPTALAQLADVNDSKQLTARQRQRSYDLIIQLAKSYGVASSSAEEIDRYGIMGATRLAMRRALALLDPPAAYLLIDGRIRLKEPALPQQSLIRGDAKSLSIAAASILAKVTRDNKMASQQDLFPAYGFARHKGYCTEQHVAALAKNGPCPIHRHTFAPIRQKLV
jgi:ribonuclease HII